MTEVTLPPALEANSGVPSSPLRLRRPELQLAFDHLQTVAGGVPIPVGASDDLRDLLVARGTVPRYGDVGEAPDLGDVQYTPVDCDGVPALWSTTPGSDPDHRVVYIHGGGWRSGSAADYRALTGLLARATGASVLAIDYRLAPEHPFPVGLDDCVRAYRWALGHGPDGRITEARRLHVVGDSAGGNLASAACLRLASTGERMPDRLAVIAGTLDNVEQERRIGLDDPICTPQQFEICTRMYLPAGHDPRDPFVSPVYASGDVLAQFPPTLLQASTIESLAWDSRRFAERLSESGAATTLSLWPDLPHVWHQFLGVFPEAIAAIEEIADHLSSETVER